MPVTRGGRFRTDPASLDRTLNAIRDRRGVALIEFALAAPVIPVSYTHLTLPTKASV